MPKIGFVREEEETESVYIPPREDILFLFDSGNSVTMESAKKHLGIFGTTGTGKTATFIHPAILRHFKAGHSGLIIDPKGNLRAKVRGIAKAAGREADVVEYGTAPSALPLNFIKDMPPARFNEFLTDLMRAHINDASCNMDFHIKGSRMATDCFQLLSWMSEADPIFTPTIAGVADMLKNPARSSELFQFFAESHADTLEKREFCDSVLASRFHILNQDKKKLTCAGSNHLEQISYNSHMILTTLRDFLDAPGIEEKFCHPDAPGLNVGGIIDSGGIVLLRFEPETGPAGGRLAREILSQFYESVYSGGVGGAYRFVCVDEFQEVADLSGNRLSDSGFIALAREFNVSFMCATQSASALRARGESEAAVDSFISNLGTKAFFFTDDPFTREIASRYDPDVELVKLKSREAFIVRNDTEFKWGIETMGNMYEAVRQIPAEREDRKSREMPPGHIFWKGMEWKPKDNEVSKKDESPKRHYDSEFQEKFPELFTEDATIIVPAGWVKFAERALAFFATLKMGVRIASLRMDDMRRLHAKPETKGSELTEFNMILAQTESICMVCGRRLEMESLEFEGPDGGTVRAESLPEVKACRKCIGDLYHVESIGEEESEEIFPF